MYDNFKNGQKTPQVPLFLIFLVRFLVRKVVLKKEKIEEKKWRGSFAKNFFSRKAQTFSSGTFFLALFGLKNGPQILKKVLEMVF